MSHKQRGSQLHAVGWCEYQHDGLAHLIVVHAYDDQTSRPFILVSPYNQTFSFSFSFSFSPFSFFHHPQMQESMNRLPRICGLRRLGLALTLIFVMFTVIILRPQYTLFDQDFGISFSTTTHRANVIDDDMSLPAWPVQVADTGVLARQSLYTRSMFTPDATSQNHFIPTSAIITRLSTDPRAIHHIVRHLLKYPFIKEIIVDDPFDNIDVKVTHRYKHTWPVNEQCCIMLVVSRSQFQWLYIQNGWWCCISYCAQWQQVHNLCQ